VLVLVPVPVLVPVLVLVLVLVPVLVPVLSVQALVRTPVLLEPTFSRQQRPHSCGSSSEFPEWDLRRYCSSKQWALSPFLSRSVRARQTRWFVDP
jgi:hypothetical protein